MRVLHVIPSLSPSSGGPSFALPAMARSLVPHGVTLCAVTTDDDGHGRHLRGVTLGQAMQQPGGWSAIYFTRQTEFYKVSLPLRSWLRAHVHEFDAVHIHALFSFASLAGARAAASRGVPYIIRPLGVLNRWGMEKRRRWIKALSFRLLELPLLKRAAAMHYTSRLEMNEASRFRLSNRQAVIPIGMDLAPFDNLPDPCVFFDKFPEASTTRNVLFLSRLDVKKGADLLLAAFAEILPDHPDVRLIICGDGDSALVASLKKQAQSLRISHATTWTGFVEGETRLAALAAAEIFVLPSHSENFGIALLEAMAAGLPCISTDQVALAADAALESAVRITAREPRSLAMALRELLSSASERNALSRAARGLARRNYSLEAMGSALHQLYQDVTHRAA